jgi:hypothetical protein
MRTQGWQDLGEYSIGDRFPFPYFVFTEKTFDVTHNRFDVEPLNPADYTAIKICIRHQDNNGDFDDHSKDDIYANLTSDGGGVYHYVWQADDIDKAGRWTVRIEFEKTDTTKFHAPFEWFFHSRHKMSGSFGEH